MNNKYFYCYSYPLKKYLNKNNLNYITKAIHEKTNKKYWIFESSDALNSLLEEWRKNKH